MEYNLFTTEVLIDCLPSGTSLRKDTLWHILEEEDIDKDVIRISQTANEDLRDFILRYYECLSTQNDVIEDVTIDVVCHPKKDRDNFKCKACNHTLPIFYQLRTEGYCHMCDPNIALHELLDETPIKRMHISPLLEIEKRKNI